MLAVSGQESRGDDVARWKRQDGLVDVAGGVGGLCCINGEDEEDEAGGEGGILSLPLGFHCDRGN